MGEYLLKVGSLPMVLVPDKQTCKFGRKKSQDAEAAWIKVGTTKYNTMDEQTFICPLYQKQIVYMSND